MSAPERWTLVRGGRTHEVLIADAGLRRHVTWSIDGITRAEARTVDEKVRLRGDDAGDGAGGAVEVRLPRFVGPARRVTLQADDPDAPDGVDFVPEPGSRAARREARIRAHPRRHELVATVVGVVGLVAPLVLVAVLARFAFSLPLPDLPLPRVSLPDIPWPSWPRPRPHLPGWVAWTLDKTKYVIPVVVAFAIARGEVRRRRAQDARRAHEAGDEASPHG